MSDVYKEALYDILECSSLYIAKELAAEALDENLDEYLDEPRESELNFDEDVDNDNLNVKDILSQFD